MVQRGETPTEDGLAESVSQSKVDRIKASGCTGARGKTHGKLLKSFYRTAAFDSLPN